MRTITLRSAVIMVLFAVALDRITKYLAVNYYIDNNFYSLYVNTEGVFSFGVSNQTMIVVSVIVIFLITVWCLVPFPGERKFSFATTVLLVGALSNLYDRLAYGGVIDFIHIGQTTVINLSDIYIIVPLVFLVIGVDKYYVLR